MPQPFPRPPTWLMTLIFVSGLGLVLVPSCKHVPLFAGTLCAMIGAFVVVAAVASALGIPVSRHAEQVVRRLLRRQRR